MQKELMGCLSLKYQDKTFSTFGSAIKTRAYSSGAYRYGFNGMEEEDELNGSGNAYDFGARIYDGRLGKWMSLDPMANLYPNISQFCYTNDNPILFIDIDGKVLVLHGGTVEKTKVQSLLSASMGSSVNLNIDANGTVSLTGEPKNMTTQQQVVYNELFKVIENAKTTDVLVLNKDQSDKAIGGGWRGASITKDGVEKKINTIDVYDAETLGEESRDLSATGVIIHEIEETFQDQVNGINDYETAHKKALAVQGSVDGVTLSSNTGLDTDNNGSVDQVQSTYFKFGIEHIFSLDLKDNDFVKGTGSTTIAAKPPLIEPTDNTDPANWGGVPD